MTPQTELDIPQSWRGFFALRRLILTCCCAAWNNFSRERPAAISPVRDQLYISSFAMAYATRFLRRKGYSYAMLSGSNFWQASAHG